jgi:hypothetical protein
LVIVLAFRSYLGYDDVGAHSVGPVGQGAANGEEGNSDRRPEQSRSKGRGPLVDERASVIEGVAPAG